MKKYQCAILFILLSLFWSCNLNVAKHNYLDAAEVTKQYIEKLIIQNDYTKAYDMMADEFKANLDQDQFKKLTVETHKNNFPKTFEINEFETYSGQEFISIFIVTKNYSPQLYYRVTLSGTSKKGYVIAGFHVSSKPIPAEGNRLPIEPNISIGGA